MAIISKKEVAKEKTAEDVRSEFAKQTAELFRKAELVRREVFKQVKSVINKPQDYKVG